VSHSLSERENIRGRGLQAGNVLSGCFSAVFSGYLERNPYSSCREIAKNLLVSKTTISRGLEEMGPRFFIARRVPYDLSAESNAKRVDICQEMLEILEKLSPRQKNHDVTGNEFWIYWDDCHRGQWTTYRAASFPRIRIRISPKKTMISAHFTRQGFVSIEIFPETCQFNSIFFTKTISPSFVQSANLFHPKMQAQGHWRHVIVW
jgi:hypothetical protein